MLAKAGSALLFCLLFAGQPLAEDAIGRLNHAGYRQKRHCTAVLVSPGLALTAAHCLKGLVPTESHLLLGYDRGQWREHLQPSHVVDLGRDLMALCFSRPAKTEAMPLAAAPAKSGEILFDLGYGVPAVHVLKETSCPVAARDGKGGLLLDCALDHGDSGGPVLRRDSAADSVVAIAVASNDSHSLAIEVPESLSEAICQR